MATVPGPRASSEPAHRRHGERQPEAPGVDGADEDAAAALEVGTGGAELRRRCARRRPARICLATSVENGCTTLDTTNCDVRLASPRRRCSPSPTAEDRHQRRPGSARSSARWRWPPYAAGCAWSSGRPAPDRAEDASVDRTRTAAAAGGPPTGSAGRRRRGSAACRARSGSGPSCRRPRTRRPSPPMPTTISAKPTTTRRRSDASGSATSSRSAAIGGSARRAEPGGTPR